MGVNIIAQEEWFYWISMFVTLQIFSALILPRISGNQLIKRFFLDRLIFFRLSANIKEYKLVSFTLGRHYSIL